MKNQQTKNSIFYFLFSRFLPILLLSTFYFLFSYANAASIRAYFSAPSDAVVGEAFPVKLLLDSDQPLNAYDIKLRFSNDILEVASFNNSNSLIGVWQSQPVASSDGTVRISGGSFESWSGRGGEIITVNFLAKQAGMAEIGFSDAAVFLANGKGTKVSPTREKATINIAENTEVAADSGNVASAIVDHVPPEIKILSLTADPFSDSRKLVGFTVSDSGSGIKTASLRFRKFIFWSDWRPSQNPTALEPGIWAAELKVVDNAGNTTSKIVYDRGALGRTIAIIGSIIIVIAAIFLYYLRRRRPAVSSM